MYPIVVNICWEEIDGKFKPFWMFDVETTDLNLEIANFTSAVKAAVQTVISKQSS